MQHQSETRQVTWLKSGWRFTRGDPAGGAEPGWDDSAWGAVRVPHDWAIAGPFDRGHDLQFTKVVEDGETTAQDNTGRTGGLPHVGVGWYRRRFVLPVAAPGRRVLVEFDGVMSHSVVYLNGRRIGSWPYGYASFCFDITEHVRVGGENVLAVRVDNKPCASRWYPGAGIYRNVRLVSVHPVHVAHWGTHVTVPELSGKAATVRLRTEVVSHLGEARDMELVTEVWSPSGERVAVSSSTQRLAGRARLTQDFRIEAPVRWDVDRPEQYRAVSTLRVNGEPVDEYATSFGIRDVRFDADQGFFLNGRRLKLNGVCMHHDLGALGTAVNRRGIERQLEILREMGCNAIRTSHNPPAPELLDLCDAMGFLVIDEAFDEWRLAKVDNGYHVLFDEWAESDLVALLRRDRNHPCVIMWSIGNEIGEQREAFGVEVARFLTEICHREDPTRPVTAGFNASDPAIANGLAEVVDIPGWNYRPAQYAQYHAEHPEWIQYGSETESCVSSRGEYYFPVEEERNVRRDTLQVSSYDRSAPGWGYSPDREFEAQEACPFILGEFVWTGFDYLGEPTPYKEEWPSRSSYFGIVDLCGFPKDRFYLYQSHWSKREVLHILPHWNWPGREGDITPVHCYTSYDAAELFVNGQSMGVRKKAEPGPFGAYRLTWDEVRYEPGELKVVAIGPDGAAGAERTLRTSGPAAAVELASDREVIDADGDDLAFVTVRVVDASGHLCPLADNLVEFFLEGPGEIVAVDNGDPTSLESFTAPRRRAFHGLCLVVIRSAAGQAGRVRLTATAVGLAGDEEIVSCETPESGQGREEKSPKREEV